MLAVSDSDLSSVGGASVLPDAHHKLESKCAHTIKKGRRFKSTVGQHAGSEACPNPFGHLAQEFQGQGHRCSRALSLVDPVSHWKLQPSVFGEQYDEMNPMNTVVDADKRELLAGLLDAGQIHAQPETPASPMV